MVSKDMMTYAKDDVFSLPIIIVMVGKFSILFLAPCNFRGKWCDHHAQPKEMSSVCNFCAIVKSTSTGTNIGFNSRR